jgi:hypothetical protein
MLAVAAQPRSHPNNASVQCSVVPDISTNSLVVSKIAGVVQRYQGLIAEANLNKLNSWASTGRRW